VLLKSHTDAGRRTPRLDHAISSGLPHRAQSRQAILVSDDKDRIAIMTKMSKRFAIVLSAVAAATAVITATALAASDTDDNIVPANTSFTATNSGSVTFTATINTISVTTTCTTANISGTTPGSGLSGNINDPTFSGCTDNRGGTDTVKANHNNGSWTLTFVDSTNETENPDSAEGAGTTGDGLQLGIPKAGVTVTSTALFGCTITGAPTAPASITATYDDVNTATFSGVNIPISGSGTCSTGPTSTFTGKYVSNVNIHDAS
jgi:hypothetical protein